ncbi:hypothetical protein [Bacillus sp. 03113]|uniref:UPF0738 family protein n=1 Tax=Bacillus sp. 03113 TaxID=2578211 RepID=UPI00114448CB|nr:hypothetical protein [Bacillus sp. 03113]
MRKKLHIVKSNFNDKNELHLEIDDLYFNNLQPLGQMLVDSDEHAFIYLAELNDEYTYIVLDESVWPKLKEAMEEKTTVFIKQGENSFLLTNIHEELSYLVENIKGNSNYGKDMVSKVEAVFS